MKNGLTLIELLAVIVILGILSLIAGFSVNSILKENTEKLYNTQLGFIEQAARNYIAANPFALPDEGESLDITLETLKTNNFIDSTIINPKTNEEFSNGLIVRITNTTGTYTYEVIGG